MSKGRKAEPGTYEARAFVSGKDFEAWINVAPVNSDAKLRLKKAVRFGLGLKSPEQQEEEKQAKIKALQEELNNLKNQ